MTDHKVESRQVLQVMWRGTVTAWVSGKDGKTQLKVIS